MPEQSPFDEAERRIVTGHLLVRRSFGHVYEEGTELSELDDETLLDELDAAGEHVLNALWALHREWDDLDVPAFEEAMFSLEERYSIGAAPKTATKVELVGLLITQALSELEAVHLDGELLPGPVDEAELTDETESALAHLEAALFLLDPEAFRQMLSQAPTPEARVRIASRLEVLELDLEDSRALAGAHLAWSSSGTKFHEFQEREPRRARELMVRSNDRAIEASVVVRELMADCGMTEQEARVFVGMLRL